MVILAVSVAPSEQEQPMPLVRLEVRKGRSATQKRVLLDAAHAALVEALGIPDHDRMQRIVEHTRADFELPPASSDVFVVLQEAPIDNWGIRGGQMASEVDLGFEVQV
jgi:phenylpyruvate tautomerase PptA (4-oxalocrotonate tautomerase family)